MIVRQERTTAICINLLEEYLVHANRFRKSCICRLDMRKDYLFRNANRLKVDTIKATQKERKINYCNVNH